MPTNQTERDALLAGLEMDTGLRLLLQMFSDDLGWTKNELDPYVLQASLNSVVSISPPPPPPVRFSYTLNPTHVKLEWAIDDEVDDNSVYFYEIRKGAEWDSAAFVLRTLSIDCELDPIVEGSHTYLLKTANNLGKYSSGVAQVDIDIPAVGLPSNIIPLVIDNHVLLDWDPSTSTFKLDYYKLYEGATFRGTVEATFFGFFESAAGTYNYGIVAVDIAGNESGKAVVEVDVREPPDFVFEDDYDSVFDGTKNLCKLYEGRLLCTVDPAETFAVHFTSRAWAGPSAQIAAGYPIYIQPSEVSGAYYEEEHDWGLVYTDTIVNVAWTYEVIYSTVSISCQIWGKKLSGDGWTGPISASSAFFQDVRYIKVRLSFTPDDDKCLMWLLSLRFVLDVKKAMDSGEAIPDKTDALGTEVFFNESFKRVDSIAAGTEDVEPLWVAIDKPTGADPTSFKVFVFDSEGQRVGDGSTGPVIYWTARGVI